jgi:hypothetical protein
MVVFLSFIEAKVSHVEAPKTGPTPKAASVNRILILVMVGGSILAYYHGRTV